MFPLPAASACADLFAGAKEWGNRRGKGNGKGNKKAPAKTAGAFVICLLSKNQPPQEPELQEPELHPPPPPTGLVEVMENPERYPASIKSTFIAPQEFSRSSSTRKVRLSSSKVLSLSFGSSRANPSDGPAQPPCIRAMRTAESILFCERYVFKFSTAEFVTSNTLSSFRQVRVKIIKLSASPGKRR